MQSVRLQLPYFSKRPQLKALPSILLALAPLFALSEDRELRKTPPAVQIVITPRPIGPDTAVALLTPDGIRLVTSFQVANQVVRLDSMRIEQVDTVVSGASVSSGTGTAGFVHDPSVPDTIVSGWTHWWTTDTTYRVKLAAYWTRVAISGKPSQARRIDPVPSPAFLFRHNPNVVFDSVVNREYVRVTLVVAETCVVNCSRMELRENTIPVVRTVDSRSQALREIDCAVWIRIASDPDSVLSYLAQLARSRPFPVIAEVSRDPVQVRRLRPTKDFPFAGLPLPGSEADIVWRAVQKLDVIETFGSWPVIPKGWSVDVGRSNYDAIADGSLLAAPDDTGSALVGSMWTGGMNTRIVEMLEDELVPALPAVGTRWLGFMATPDSDPLAVFGGGYCGSSMERFRVVGDSVDVWGHLMSLDKVRALLGTSSVASRASENSAIVIRQGGSRILSIRLPVGGEASASMMDASGAVLWSSSALVSGSVKLPQVRGVAWLRVESNRWRRIIPVGP